MVAGRLSANGDADRAPVPVAATSKDIIIEATKVSTNYRKVEKLLPLP